MVSRQFFAFVTSSSNCLIRDSKSEEHPDVDWVDGGACGCSGSRDLGVGLEALFRVIVKVIEGFDNWALFRVQLSSKAAEQGGLTVKGKRSEEGEGSLTCRRNWASSS